MIRTLLPVAQACPCEKRRRSHEPVASARPPLEYACCAYCCCCCWSIPRCGCRLRTTRSNSSYFLATVICSGLFWTVQLAPKRVAGGSAAGAARRPPVASSRCAARPSRPTAGTCTRTLQTRRSGASTSKTRPFSSALLACRAGGSVWSSSALWCAPLPLVHTTACMQVAQIV
jgi:hypothetical protein